MKNEDIWEEKKNSRKERNEGENVTVRKGRRWQEGRESGVKEIKKEWKKNMSKERMKEKEVRIKEKGDRKEYTEEGRKENMR